MNGSPGHKPDYSNWVSGRLVYVPGAAGLLCLGLSALFLPMIVVAVPLFLACAYFAYARYRFSPAGGNAQDKVQDLVLAWLDWDGTGRALDIGCGNGPLTIKLAHRFPQARITGIDSWGERWEYSKNVCERNAMLEGVAARVAFQKASAEALPFGDESFDTVVSNLVFHEVGHAKDKRELVREALRVVKRKGSFAFQDLFLAKGLYGETDELLAAVRSWGVTRVEFVRTCDEPFIPPALKLPFMVGTMGILRGEK